MTGSLLMIAILLIFNMWIGRVVVLVGVAFFYSSST